MEKTIAKTHRNQREEVAEPDKHKKLDRTVCGWQGKAEELSPCITGGFPSRGHSPILYWPGTSTPSFGRPALYLLLTPHKWSLGIEQANLTTFLVSLSLL